jgi:hypothetical protein
MTVYVDTYRELVPMGRSGNWRISHMIADTRSELDEMAESLELKSRWKQDVGESSEHFDVTENFMVRAIKLGAKEISPQELVEKLQSRDLKEYLEG